MQMQATPDPISLDGYIVSTADTLGGKPRIAGTRIAVTQIKAARLRLGMPFEEIAESYDLPLPAVYAAMAYYYAHKVEIDQRDADTAAFVEDFKRRNPPPLEAKLAATADADADADADLKHGG